MMTHQRPSSLISATINLFFRGLPMVMLLLLLISHLHINRSMLQSSAVSLHIIQLDETTSIDPAEQNRKTSLLRNMGNNTDANQTASMLKDTQSPKHPTTAATNQTSSERTRTSIGKNKKIRVRSQDGIDQAHMAEDGAWIQEVTDMLNCSTTNFYTRIPTKETWDILFQAYHATVDPEKEFLTAAEYENSWKVPIEVRYNKPEGRGVYAKEFIPKGTLVWVSTSRNTATFTHTHEHRAFIQYLIDDPETRYLACDVRMWIDVMLMENGINYAICQTFDEAVLLNTIWEGDDDNAGAGAAFNLEPEQIPEGVKDPDEDDNDCYGNDHFYTTRDIEAGEQFRIDYGTGWDDGGEGWVVMGLDSE